MLLQGLNPPGCWSYYKACTVVFFFSFNGYAVSTSYPLSVMSTICSNCAVRAPSAVTTVQVSIHVRVALVPWLMMGSVPHAERQKSELGLLFFQIPYQQ